MKYHSTHLLVVAILVSCKPTADQSKDYNWALLPFTKADDVNPVLLPDTNSTFHCPVRKDTVVQWEEKDVFNPAAVVRNDTVFLLFRAEDSIGKFAGTSRIGIAWSTDGLHFKNILYRFYILIMTLKKFMNGKVAAKIQELWKMKTELTT